MIMMIMETAVLILSYKQLGVVLFSLLFSYQLQLHLLLALPQNSMVVASDLNEENETGRNLPTVPNKLSLTVKLGGKHEIKAVGRRGGGGGGRGGGGVGAHSGGAEHEGGGAATDNGGGTKSPNGQQSGAVIPVYAAGSNLNHDHHHHGSNSGIIIGSSYSVLILIHLFLLCMFYII